MDVNTDRRDDHSVVSVTGEVDLYSSPGMREALLACIAKKTPMVLVELSGVSYMDSSGIATLVEALQQMRDQSGRLVLVGLQQRVREVFELARLQSVFEMADTVEAALSGPEA